MPTPPSTIDLALLAGLSFQCRPDCGLCCFATPLVAPAERGHLIQIDPTIPFLPDGQGGSRIADQGDGGACYLLKGNRCRAHPARPFPCRVFPLSTHLGPRVQVSAVLSCPGLDLSRFLDWGDGRPPTRPPDGLDSELQALAGELEKAGVARDAAEAGRRFRTARRRLERAGLWNEPEEIRTMLRPDLLELVRTGYAPGNPPEANEGVASLPLFRDARLGLVAISGSPGGWAFLALSERGGEPGSLGVLPEPSRCPAMSAAGERALRAYLEYLLNRDLTFGQAAWGLDPEGEEPLAEEVRRDLAAVGSLVLARGSMIQRLHGYDAAPLDAAGVLDGIRATDAEVIDRPTVGLRL